MSFDEELFLIEPIVGYRTWLVVLEREGCRLHSIARSSVSWPVRKELKATCMRTFKPYEPLMNLYHTPPYEACAGIHGCGIYAVKKISECHFMFSKYSAPRWIGVHPVIHRIIGKVKLWGKVLGSGGWRGQYAYPAELWFPPLFLDPTSSTPEFSKRVAEYTLDKTALDLAEYQVPIRIMNTTEEMEKTFPGFLPENT